MPTALNEYNWELYHIAEDYSEFNDLAPNNPDKLKEMQALFLKEAGKYQVFPLDNSGFVRLLTPKPSAVAGNGIHLHRRESQAFPSAMLPAFWTGTTPSPRRSPSRRRRRGSDRHPGRPFRRLWTHAESAASTGCSTADLFK